MRELGIRVGEDVAGALERYASIVLAENKRTNLVGAKTPEQLVLHILDSLAPLVGLKLADPVVDLGSGAGLPGLVAAIVFPAHAYVLIEPRAKRAAFLERATRELGLARARVVRATAPKSASAALPGGAGTVLARAIAKPAAALALGLPLLRKRGRLIMYLGRQAQPSPGERAIMLRLGGRLVEAKRVYVPYLEAQRHAWIVEIRGRDT